MPQRFDYVHTVTPEEIDQHGHANNIAYLHWMQQAAVAHSSAEGWTPQRYFQRNVGWFARRHELDYLQPAFEGETLVICTWLESLARVRCLRRYEVIRSSSLRTPQPEQGHQPGEIVACGLTDWVFVNLTTGRPSRIPQDILQAFTCWKGGDSGGHCPDSQSGGFPDNATPRC